MHRHISNSQISAFLSTENSSFGSDVLTAQGHIAVKPTLQLLNHPNVFALGDAIDWKEQKQAAKAGNHLAILLANIPAFIAGQTLKEYKGSAELIAVTNGKVCLFYYTFIVGFPDSHSHFSLVWRYHVRRSVMGTSAGTLGSILCQGQGIVDWNVQELHGPIILQICA